MAKIKDWLLTNKPEVFDDVTECPTEDNPDEEEKNGGVDERTEKERDEDDQYLNDEWIKETEIPF